MRSKRGSRNIFTKEWALSSFICSKRNTPTKKMMEEKIQLIFKLYKEKMELRKITSRSSVSIQFGVTKSGQILHRWALLI